MHIPRPPNAVIPNTKIARRNSDKNLKANRASGAFYGKRHKNWTDWEMKVASHSLLKSHDIFTAWIQVRDAIASRNSLKHTALLRRLCSIMVCRIK